MAWKVQIRQEPKVTRNIGFRTLDCIGLLYGYTNDWNPGLVIEVVFTEEQSDLERYQLIAVASLIDPNTKEQLGTILRPLPKSNEKVLCDVVAGKRAVAGTLILDPEDKKLKIFFIFYDLGVRINGVFRFRIDCWDTSGLR
jgi:hypothetical protein